MNATVIGITQFVTYGTREELRTIDHVDEFDETSYPPFRVGEPLDLGGVLPDVVTIGGVSHFAFDVHGIVYCVYFTGEADCWISFRR